MQSSSKKYKEKCVNHFNEPFKLDGVGPVDNRPSTHKFHHFVQKKQNKKNVTCDTWHVTRDTLHVTCDTWHVTRDMF